MKRAIELLSRTGDGAFVVDKNQKILFWSGTAEKLLGYKAGEAVGKRCYELLQGCSAEGEKICRKRGPIVEKISEGAAVRHFELIVRHHEGQRVLIGVSTIPISEKKNRDDRPGLAHVFYLAGEQPVHPGLLRIYLMGQTSIKRPDGTKVEGPFWQRVKVRALFVMLALQQGRPANREKIIETLWPGHDYGAALRNLNTTVYSLRRSIEPTLQQGRLSRFILYEGGNYLLATEPAHWFDVKAFERGIRRARQLPDVIQAIKQYKHALALYRGDYLADLSDTYVYCYSEQQRLQGLYVAALEELGCLYEERGRYRKAKNLYLRALAVDPCCETACQKLIQLSLHIGDRTSAVMYCQRLRSAMTSELNVWPSKKTQLLWEMAQCEA